MDKLVSKNPILRFKLGRKIIFAKWGDKAENPTPIIDPETNEYYFGAWPGGNTIDGTKLIRDTELVEKKMKKNPFYENYHFIGPYSRISREKILDTFYPTPLDKTNSYRATGGHPTIDKKALPKTNKKLETPKSKVISGPSFYGTRAGGLVKIRDKGFTGFGNLINDELKQKLIGAGFLDNDFTNVTAFQKALNRYFAGDNAGSILEDGKWGNQTLKAFNLALSKANSPIVTTTKGIEILPASIVPTYTSPAIPSTIPNLNLNTPTYVSANRSQTRDWMRSNNINPYSVTGDMRAAIRRIRAGQANDNDKLLVKNNEQLYNLLKGYYKQGGQLLSKNSVERFKNRINKN